jgi:ABC-type sugar transport system ATPase subunit
MGTIVHIRGIHVDNIVTTSTGSEVHLIRISKHFSTDRKARLTALQNASLWIGRGQTVSVVGPSGCGKSTLLRVIAGLEQAESGTVTFDGEDVDELSPAQRGIGLVFQNYALYPHFKVRGNIGFYFRLRRWKAAAIDAKIQATSQIMGIGFEQLLGRMPRSLSGGEKQRVALARCLSHSPRVLLLDEPFSNLDAALRLKTRNEVKRLIDRFGLTTVFVTHDQDEAVAMGHRIAVMQHGQIEQVGTFHELYREPVSMFVAGFLGSPPMNFFHARYNGEYIEINMDQASVRMPAPEHLHQRLVQDEPLMTIGIRPEHLQLDSDAGPQGLAGQVEMVEVSLSDAKQTVHLRHGESTFCAKVDLRHAVRPRETLKLKILTPHLYGFDQHGKRL